MLLRSPPGKRHENQGARRPNAISGFPLKSAALPRSGTSQCLTLRPTGVVRTLERRIWLYAVSRLWERCYHRLVARPSGVKRCAVWGSLSAKAQSAASGPEPELRKRLFRPVASPGAVLRDGRLAGLWRVKAKGRKAEITVEKLGRIARRGLEEEAQRIGKLRGASEGAVVRA
jgi:hypothetical protein